MNIPELDSDPPPEIPCLKSVDPAWFIPRWRSMDGGVPRVYAIDVLASERANRPLLEDAY